MSDNVSTRTSAEERPPAGPGDRAVVVTRVLDAPRSLVWRAWTEPERLKRWWGPRGYSAPVTRTDPRVGGRYLWGMRPDAGGQEVYTTGVFREVVEPERFVVTESFADADGTVVPASHYGMAGDWPAEVVMTVVLEERDGRTAMTVREEGIPEEMRGPGEQGLRESIEKLAEYLEAGRSS